MLLQEQILPAVYNFVGASMNASPTELGNITLARAMVQACSSPIGGFAGKWATVTAASALGVGGAVMGLLAQQLVGCGNVTMLGPSPLTGHFYPRGAVIGCGCLIWAVMTALFATTSSVYAAMPICAVNGLGLVRGQGQGQGGARLGAVVGSYAAGWWPAQAPQPRVETSQPQ